MLVKGCVGVAGRAASLTFLKKGNWYTLTHLGLDSSFCLESAVVTATLCSIFGLVAELI